jgi:hypothetical protein
MGKALIQSHQGDGLYFVSYYRDVEYAQKELERLEKQRKELETAIYKPGGLNDQLIDINNEIVNKGVIFDDAMEEWKVCAAALPPCPKEKELLAAVLAAGKDKQASIVKYMTVQAKISTNKADMLVALRRMAFFQNYGTDKASEGMTVWCVDYPHEDDGPLTNGTMVGTIETYGGRSVANQDFQGPDPMINVQVSYQGNAAYNPNRDHQIQPLAAESTATALVNGIEFLGVMAKNPRYEMGTLLSKNDQTNTGTVELYGNTLWSGAPSVEGVFPKTLNNIPIVYQTCHAKVFEPGDKVIVKYDGNLRVNPTVVGFASNPVECKWLTLDYIPDQGLYLVGDVSQTVLKNKDGTPVTAYPLTDQYAFAYWSSYLEIRTDNPRTDMNVQISRTINGWSMPTPDWPDSIRVWISSTGSISTSSCCFGGTQTINGDVTTKTYNGQEDGLPESLEVTAIKEGWYLDYLESFVGGDPGVGSWGWTLEDNPTVVGHVLIDMEDSGYYVGPLLPAPSTRQFTVTHGVIRSGGAGFILETSAVVTLSQNGSSCTGSMTATHFDTWIEMLQGEAISTPEDSFIIQWIGMHNGVSVMLKRYYTYSHLDSVTSKAIFIQGGAVPP